MSDISGTYEERLQKLHITTLDERRTRGDAIEIYKYLNGFLDVNSESLFTRDSADQPKTRHQQSYMPLKVPHAKLDVRQNFFTVRGAKFLHCARRKNIEQSPAPLGNLRIQLREHLQKCLR